MRLHPNAKTTPYAREQIAERVLRRGWAVWDVAQAMAAACPVVLGVDGEARAVLERAGGGVSVPPEDAQRLAEALAALSESREECRRMGTAGRRFVTEEFNRRVWAHRYLALLERVVKGLEPIQDCN